VIIHYGVLRIAKLGSGAERYYLQAVGPEPPGSWLGRGPHLKGLDANVGPDELSALLAGRDPFSGEVLGARRERVRVVGFDMTFAAPKSVSVLHGLAEEAVSGEVAAGHTAAVAAAVDYADRRALAVRRHGPDGRTVEATDGGFGAAFVHRTSRSLDPHLHTHVVVANLGRGPDGRFSALDGRGIYAHAGAMGALYHSQLREELGRRLGVEWGPLDRGRADLVGVPREVRLAFSRRSREIAAELAASGRTGPRATSRATEIASVKTREPKDPSLGPDDLRPEWRRRAVEMGFGPLRLESVLERGARARDGGACRDGPVRSREDTEERTERVVLRLAAEGRPIARRSVVRAWCMETGRGAPVPEIERAADSLLETLDPAGCERDRDGGPIHRPGVAEKRFEPDWLELGPLASRAAELARDRSAAVRRARGLGLEPARDAARSIGYELGLGRGDSGLGL